MQPYTMVPEWVTDGTGPALYSNVSVEQRAQGTCRIDGFNVAFSKV